MTTETQQTERPALAETQARTIQHLLNQRGSTGHWTGCLSSSALSTATALFALSLYLRQNTRLTPSEQEPLRTRIEQGIGWLVATQNDDGGWGDTTLSLSNISTTALCWAALSVATDLPSETQERAENWLIRAAGSLEPKTLARTITARYGKDRTFSVPILTMCALAGRLGKPEYAWRLIPRLPFELAACPYQWFQWLRLPVVSYALPALIAIGQVEHHFNPTKNPLLRWIRNRTRTRTLDILRSIQPEGGGFLEATPLTSFVSMSLLGCGLWEHPVVEAGIDFLARSAREDGSWPIDTDLATWLTTLSINALAADPDFETHLPQADRETLRRWLLGQQYREEHPYTHAAPGGWAWTDLPGGVPDADDTAGALLALFHLGSSDESAQEAARHGIDWLLTLQNRDGGIPTFCRGWGALPFDRSGADLTAHTLHAWNLWRAHMPPECQQRIRIATHSALEYLRRQQRADGAWVPLWFGHQNAPEEQNPTYGTARVLLALLALTEDFAPLAPMQARGVQWLLQAQNEDGGWGGDRGCASSLEETGLAVQAFSLALWRAELPQEALRAAIERGLSCLTALSEQGTAFSPSPIGFYFARLWYFEDLYPLIYSAGGWAACASRCSS